MEDIARDSIKSTAATEDNGRFRRTNEDEHICDDTRRYYGVFDGHGGNRTAILAKKKFFNLHENNMKTCINMSEAWKQTYNAMDTICEEKEEFISGSTVAAAVLRTQDSVTTIYASNAGDARIVLGSVHMDKEGHEVLGAKRLTFDHKPTDQTEQERIVQAGGYVAYDRTQGVISISRSIGDLEYKQYIISDPFTSETIVTSDDKYLILACDGVWDVISDLQAVTSVHESTKKDPITRASLASDLVQLSLMMGSTDNITAVVVNL